MCCSSCFAVPLVTIRLLATSVALLYGQRLLCANPSRGKWTRRITLVIAVLVSLALSGLGIFLLVLGSNDGYRSSNFASLCVSQNLRSSPLDEHRCSILREGGVSGRVLEFGPGPGTNFRCFQNDTRSNIEEYVAVEPNPFFEEEMRKEHDVRGLTFPLRFVGIKGEDVDETGSFDVVILTHVLCSVDSVADVLANAERALKPGGRIIFMEHVVAKENTFTWYEQCALAPILYIVGNGCTFRDLRDDIGSYLGDRFEIKIQDFYAPGPLLMHFVRPHIKGVATKK